MKSRTFGWPRISSWGHHAFTITLSGLFGSVSSSHFQRTVCFRLANTRNIASRFSIGSCRLWRLEPSEK
uniref:Putative secreted protein n=1 Tax=Anopheles marajoara TaxID=58244 RepID=A0A2M4CF80_9DIPT